MERAATVNLREVAAKPRRTRPVRHVKPRPRPRRARPSFAAPREAAPTPVTASTGAITTSFLAELDDGTATPPDTGGAVGPQHVVTALNSSIQIQDRSGNVISSVVLEDFWAPAGPIREFATDPHVLYDRGADRWITCVLADPEGASALLAGVSDTGDPTGTWSLYRIAIGPGRMSGDYPLIGFNGNWVVVTLNMYNRNTTFDHSAIYVFSKADFYAGGNSAPQFKMYTDPNDTWYPVMDFDNVTNRLFLVEDYDGPNAQLAVSEIRGDVGSETFFPEIGFVNAPSPWEDGSPAANGNFAPQLGTTARIDTGDSRLLSCLLRNGAVWCSQTVFLPVGIPRRSAAQWIAFDPNSYAVKQFGRMDDPANVDFYAYPSVAVNRNNDALIGFTHFSGQQFPSADFVFRAGSDPANTIGPDTVIKPGESFYRVTGPGSSGNRWGDFSMTVVDPTDDLSFWTIQEFAASPADGGMPRWGTWWAQIVPNASGPATQAQR